MISFMYRDTDEMEKQATSTVKPLFASGHEVDLTQLFGVLVSYTNSKLLAFNKAKLNSVRRPTL